MRSKVWYPYAGLAVLALASGVFAGYLVFGAHPLPRPRTDALLLQAPKPLPEFSLMDDTGHSFTRASLQGHWSLIYTGYTHCPDACPTTLAALNQTTKFWQQLPADKHPRVYFISVDPQRDTPELLKNYTVYFNPDFMGVTGSQDQLQALTAPLGLDFSYEKPDAKGNYGVVHATAVMLVDPESREVALYTPPLDPKRMAADYMNIIRYYGERW
jgi:protein SCO1/2